MVTQVFHPLTVVKFEEDKVDAFFENDEELDTMIVPAIRRVNPKRVRAKELFILFLFSLVEINIFS